MKRDDIEHGEAGKIRVALPEHDIPLIINGARFRHLKRGSSYTMLFGGMAAGDIKEGDAVVAYIGEDGRIWFRKHEEFHDGRFERR